MIEANYPVRIEYNQQYQELYFAGKSDIRCLDIFNGKTKRIIANIVDDMEEIGEMRLFFDNKTFLVANSSGEMRLHSITDGAVKK